MGVPLDRVFRRGAVFLWTTYGALDDPALGGQTKPKFIVILSASIQDDPYYYVLTTSEKAKHANHPHKTDLIEFAAGSYGWFSATTLLDAGEAGQLEVGKDEFAALYESGELLYRGCLSEDHVAAVVEKIHESRRVSRWFKQTLRGV